MFVGSWDLSQAPSYLRMHDLRERLWGPMECQSDNWLWESLSICVSARFQFLDISFFSTGWGAGCVCTHIYMSKTVHMAQLLSKFCWLKSFAKLDLLGGWLGPVCW